MFRSKNKTGKQVENKPNPIVSTHAQWAENAVSPRSDRVMIYLEGQDKLTPKQLHSTIKKYWITAIVLNMGVLLLMVHGMYTIITKNIENPVKMVRVDGKLIEESEDERRRILIDNVIKRVEIKEQNNQDPEEGT